MDWQAYVQSALSSVSSPSPDADVIEELAHHADAEYERARADGLSHEEAKSQVDALLARWKADAASLRRRRSRHRSVIEPPPAEPASPFAGILHDVRYAARLLHRQSRFSLIAILTLALGIGTTTLMFSVTYGVLMERLPWPDADRLVVLKESRGGKPPRFGSFTNAAYLAWNRHSSTLEALGAWSPRTVTVTGAGDAERIRITAASASLLAALGARASIGTLFEEKDETSPVVLLSESLWRQRFGGDPAVLGRAIHFDGQSHTIIGVLPDQTSYPDRQSRAWVPFRVPPADGNHLSMFEAVGKLRPDTSVAQAAAEGTARGRFAPDAGMTAIAVFGNRDPIEITAQPLRDALTGDVRRPLIVMLVAVGLLLFTATANIASLQLARATTRRREIAMRAALGASAGRVTRQLLIESLLLSTAGGAAGLLVAWTLHGWLPTVLPPDFPRVVDLRLGGTGMAFATLLAFVTGVLFGVIPASRVRRVDLLQALTADSTAPVAGVARSRTRPLIMAGQVAIACVLLVAAALLGRSFFVLLSTDRGYDPAGVLTARIAFSTSYKAPQRHAHLRAILDRLTSTPGVVQASFTSELPLGPGGSTTALTIRSTPSGKGPVTAQASPRIVSERYFAAAGIRILQGRGFSEDDNETAPPVVVVNRAFSRRFLDDHAVGTKVPMGAGYEQPRREATIVGVVDDIRYVMASDASQPEIYFSYRQFDGRLPVSVVTLIIRSAAEPVALTRPLRTAVREADDALVADSILTMEQRMLRVLARPRLYAIVLGGFAVSALLVAAVGLFGVLSYSVAQRTRELAVRTALGARKVDLVKLVFGQTMVITAAGIILGLMVSFVVMKSIAALLYGVTPHDTLTFVTVPVILMLVSAAACLPPSLRAAKLDPLRALRE